MLDSVQTACGSPITKRRLASLVGPPKFGVGLATSRRASSHRIDLILTKRFCQLLNPRRIGPDQSLFGGGQNVLLQTRKHPRLRSGAPTDG